MKQLWNRSVILAIRDFRKTLSQIETCDCPDVIQILKVRLDRLARIEAYARMRLHKAECLELGNVIFVDFQTKKRKVA